MGISLKDFDKLGLSKNLSHKLKAQVAWTQPYTYTQDEQLQNM